MNCKIVEVGRRRDGGFRYWCLCHKADATAKYGKQSDRCVAADDEPIDATETREIDIRSFAGGVGLWGAVPAVYDTTSRPLDRGIHVHARRRPNGPKFIDQTYRRLSIPLTGDLLGEGWTEVDELDAINFMVSRVFGFAPIDVRCGLCGFPHLDRDWFAVHPHRRHLCHGCGRHFSDTRVGVGNPLSVVRQRLNVNDKATTKATRELTISQADYVGGIAVWGSNPAIIWTASSSEQSGIHVHAYKSKHDPEPFVDDTFAGVSIDGVVLDETQVRFFMAQSAMPHIEGRVVSLSCPKCKQPHFDVGELAYTPHIEHVCEGCGTEFRATTRFKRTIGNPFVEARRRLASHAVAPLRVHRLGFRPETI